MSKRIARLSLVLASTVVGVVRASAQQTGATQGETKKMSTGSNVQLLAPATMPKSVGYSQIATVSGGTMVFISGQVAMDNSGNVVGKDDFRAQTEQVFSNLKAALDAVGGNFSDVVKLNYYLVDLSRLPDLRDVRDRYVNVSNPPTSTAVQVTRLFRPELLVEVEAVAVLKGK
jgi:enamine deaminase RidA (YjgF/YER057c/UK114 family)